MSLFSRFPVTRWLVPAAAVVVLLGGTSLARTVFSSDAASQAAALPGRTPAELLADVAAARVENLSGTVVQNSDLGIPDLPGLNLGNGTSLTSLLTGSHTLRVWYGGRDRQRFALLGDLGETDVIHNGADLWIWSSKDNTASHRTVTAGDAAPTRSLPSGSAAVTPQSAAALALRLLEPTTTVTPGTNDVVAGRPAYELVLQPKDTRSLVASVRIAVDGQAHIPLRVTVTAAGMSTPAFEIAFTAVDFGAPDASEFSFNPPPGVTLNQGDGQAAPGTARPGAPCTATGTSAGTPAPDTSAARPRLVGSGWTSVVVATLPAGSTSGSARSGCAAPGLAGDLGVGSLSRIARSLPAVSGSWGSGHLLSGTLVTVLITDDGRVAAGPVPADLLYQALGK